ncbi:cytochrome P450 4V2-like protein, partial [Dinothrombium tinctorium]
KYWFDFVFFHTKFGKKFRNCVDLVHDFSLKVIEKRKNEILEERAKNGNQTRTQAEDTIFLGSKRKKVAFIDLLINNHIDGLKADGSSDFSLADVCEEVDTFMFEGFETTAVAISWTLHLLGNDERAQNKAYEEIRVIRIWLKIRKIPYVYEESNFLLGHFKLFLSKPPNVDIQDYVNIKIKELMPRYRDKKLIVVRLFCFPYTAVTNADAIEAVLSNTKILKKSPEYRYFETWIGTGLLTSAPEKWKGRRKMLTPTFHFRILQDFLKVMNEHSMTLVDIIKQNDGKVMNLFEYIPLTTLDTICETAMGVCVDAQRNPKSDYVNAIVLLNSGIFKRFYDFPSWLDVIFYHTKLGKEFKKSVALVHKFSLNVIEKRKKDLIEDRRKGVYVTTSDETIFLGSKKRKVAFIDLLIHNHIDTMKDDGTSSFTLKDICEEVDTFMFEGFETTAAAVAWTLHLIGCHEKVQRKAYEEICELFADDVDRFVVEEDLQKLRYIECCIKEGLRLYPSVPLFARRTTEDVNICGFDVPKDVTILIYPMALHRDPNIFSEPNRFKPERFFEENFNRNPFAFVPFSAGP